VIKKTTHVFLRGTVADDILRGTSSADKESDALREGGENRPWKRDFGNERTGRNAESCCEKGQTAVGHKGLRADEADVTRFPRSLGRGNARTGERTDETTVIKSRLKGGDLVPERR